MDIRTLLRGRRGAAVNSMLASGVAQLFILVSGVLVARALGVQGRGELALIALLGFVSHHVSMLGLPQAMTFLIASRAATSRSLLAELRGVMIGQAVVGGVLFALLGVLITVNFRSDVATAVAVGLLAPPGLTALRLAFAVLQGEEAYGALNTLRLVQPATYAIVLLMFLAAGDTTLPMVVGAWTCSIILGASVMVYAARRTIIATRVVDTSPRSGHRDQAIRLGVRGFLGSASPIDVFRADQAVAGLVLSPAALGLYAAGMALTSLPRLLAQAVGVVAFPTLAATKTQSEARKLTIRLTRATAAMVGAIVVALVLLSGVLVPLLFGEEFNGAIGITRLLLIASFFTALRMFLIEALRGLGDPASGSWSEVMAWATLVPLMVALVPAFGLDGIGIALIASSCASSGLLYWRVLRPRPLSGAPVARPHVSPIAQPGAQTSATREEELPQ